MTAFITHVEWKWNPVMGMYDCIPHWWVTRSMTSMSDKEKATLKADKKDTTAEERELSQRGVVGSGRHSGAWERDAEAAKARNAAARVDAADAEAKKAQTGSPEVPGADSYTHGGSGAPPETDPEVQALIDSGTPLEVGGDNKLREVKRQNTA